MGKRSPPCRCERDQSTLAGDGVRKIERLGFLRMTELVPCAGYPTASLKDPKSDSGDRICQMIIARASRSLLVNRPPNRSFHPGYVRAWTTDCSPCVLSLGFAVLQMVRNGRDRCH
jgi:hypothetical protein